MLSEKPAEATVCGSVHGKGPGQEVGAGARAGELRVPGFSRKKTP